ncbi:hypothetical protein, partial [Neisseria musculi]|uniref:hypothetical protein n=1 Tax=Neisseria musculi TaxID=1815583 RepID=UPI003623A176
MRENFCNRLLFEMGMFAFGRVTVAPFGQIAVKPFHSKESQHLRDSVVYYVGIWPGQGFGADVLINGSAVDVGLFGDLSDGYALMKQTACF